MSLQNRTVEQEVARLAGRAHGVVGRAELLAAVVSSDQIRWRLGRGDLIVEFRAGIGLVMRRRVCWRATR